MANIAEIEKELEGLLSTDKKSWVRIYELMEIVDREKLYEENFKSYTGWVNAFADKAKVHVSLLWNRKKAGKVYSAYEERAKEKGQSVPTIEEVRVSADNFNLIEKIAGNNTKIADELIDKVIQGEMKRTDLKNAWSTVKANREAVGKKSVRVNAYDKDDIKVESEKITATDIVLALSNKNWMDEEDIFYCRYAQEKYKLMTEFAVPTGTSRHARRMDALILENLTVETDKNYNLHLHAIEIKVNKHDLVSDHKMQEYIEYADYFWLVVPEHLETVAKDIIV